MALGKDIFGQVVVSDLAKMPHLLVAGSTGSGKSVSVNTMILSLLYRGTPDDVRLIMIDPKMLELSIYEGIPHLLLPVVTEPKKASLALAWAVREMERRYKLMADKGVRNIDGYNRKLAKEAKEVVPEPPPADPAEDFLDDLPPLPEPDPKEELDHGHLPYIVVIVDELADLMMVVGREIEESIARLAQMARAAGIHLILATQRPSVDVITGLIKANFPTRMSFKVFSRTDSRTILDSMGAETLLGMGDMLFLPRESVTCSGFTGHSSPNLRFNVLLITCPNRANRNTTSRFSPPRKAPPATAWTTKNMTNAGTRHCVSFPKPGRLPSPCFNGACESATTGPHAWWKGWNWKASSAHRTAAANRETS